MNAEQGKTDSASAPGATPPGASAPGATSSATASACAAGSIPQAESGRRDATGSGAGSTAEEVEDLRHKVEFGTHVSMRYHARRRAFLDALHRGSSAIGAITATAAVTALFGSASTLAQWMAGVAAIATALDTVFDFAGMARRHDDLYQRFCSLAAEMARTPQPTAEKVHEWRERRLMIEKDEPTPKDVLAVICHNVEAEVRELPDWNRHRIRWWQRYAAPLVSLPPDDFPRLVPPPAP